MPSAAVLAGICIGTGFGVGVGVALSVFFLFYCGCWTCPDDSLEEELEFRGIPLNSCVPELSEEQRQIRDKALGRYRRHMEREEIRQQRREARTRRDQLRAEGLDLDDDVASREGERYDTASIASTATSHLNSTVVYGHGNYEHPPSMYADTRTNSRAGTRRNSLSESVGGHSTSSRGSRGTMASIRGFFRHNNRRTKAKRRHRREDPNRSMEIFQQWATGSSSSLSSSSLSGHRRAEHHEDGHRSSIASSLPRPPDDVMMAGMHLGSHHPSLPSSMPLHTTGSLSEPPMHLPVLLHPERSLASTRRSLMSSNDTHTRRAGVAVVELEPPHDDGGMRTPDSCPLSPSMGAARPTTVEEDWRKKKWTGRDVENNVAMSGFFATTQSLPMAPHLSPPRSPSLPPSATTTSQPQPQPPSQP